jgi:hypothetical protein
MARRSGWNCLVCGERAPRNHCGLRRRTHWMRSCDSAERPDLRTAECRRPNRRTALFNGASIRVETPAWKSTGFAGDPCGNEALATSGRERAPPPSESRQLPARALRPQCMQGQLQARAAANGSGGTGSSQISSAKQHRMPPCSSVRRTAAGPCPIPVPLACGVGGSKIKLPSACSGYARRIANFF